MNIKNNAYMNFNWSLLKSINMWPMDNSEKKKIKRITIKLLMLLLIIGHVYIINIIFNKLNNVFLLKKKLHLLWYIYDV